MNLATPHPRLRWFQWRLRTLLVLVTLVSVGLGWLSFERQKVRVRNEWHASLKQRGAAILKNVIKKGPQAQPTWLRTLLGNDSTANVELLYFNDTAVTDARLVHLGDLTQLKWLQINSSQVTDAGLVHLSGLTQLIVLSLNGTSMTDAGLSHLAGLTQLQCLDLNQTGVTDAGLVHLAGLNQLRQLHLRETAVTDAGYQELKRALPNLTIYR